VIADGVSSRVDGAGDLRSLAHILADQEESRFRVVLGQKVEQTLGVGIVGAVVEGERHVTGIAAVRHRSAVELRRGRHGSVTGISGSGRRGSGRNESGKDHWVTWYVGNWKPSPQTTRGPFNYPVTNLPNYQLAGQSILRTAGSGSIFPQAFTH